MGTYDFRSTKNDSDVIDVEPVAEEFDSIWDELNWKYSHSDGNDPAVAAKEICQRVNSSLNQYLIDVQAIKTRFSYDLYVIGHSALFGNPEFVKAKVEALSKKFQWAELPRGLK